MSNTNNTSNTQIPSPWTSFKLELYLDKQANVHILRLGRSAVLGLVATTSNKINTLHRSNHIHPINITTIHTQYQTQDIGQNERISKEQTRTQSHSDAHKAKLIQAITTQPAPSTPCTHTHTQNKGIIAPTQPQSISGLAKQRW